jgi:vitamin B12 transporter
LVAPGRAQRSGFSDSVTVTATLLEEERDDVPASIAVVSEEEIARRQALELHQVLSTVAGAAVAQSGSPGHSTSAFLRGTNSNHTLVLWNGVPLNETFEGRFDFAFLPLEGADRVEVARGPFSALYGSALGGVVQVITQRASGAPGGRLRAEAGEHGYRRGGFAGRHGLGAAAAASLTASVRRGDGEAPNDFYDGEDAAFRLELGRGAASGGLIARFNDSDVGTPFDGATPSPRSRTAWRESQLALPLSFAARSWSAEAHASHSQTELAFRNPDSFFSPGSESEGERSRVRGVARRTFGAGWIAGGGEWSEEEATYLSDFTDSFGPIESKRRTNAAAFAQAHATVARWTFEAGVRHDDNGDFGGHTSPRIGVLTRLGERGRLFASYGEAFRAPSFLELYFPFYGNPALEPEVSRSAEIGWSWDGPARLSLTVYQNRVRNLIEGPPPTFLAANVGRARMRGAELVAAVARGRFDARLSATFLEAENLATGAPLVRRPEESASLVLAWTPARWTFSAVGRWVGERPDFDPATFAPRTNPSYARLDFATAFQLGRGVELLGRVENAGDEDYEEVLGFPAPGRTLAGGLGWKF